MNSDDFFDGAGERPESVAGRYRLPHPETGIEQSWTRATTHAELPEDSFALTRWQLRQLVKGLRRRPDLLRLIESWPNEPDREQLDAVIATAHEVAGNDARANLGTAVHGVLQQVDRIWPADRPADEDWLSGALATVPEWAHPHVRGYVAELRRHGLKPIPAMTERQVVNLDLGCAGTLDNLYEETDGTIALGDKKTGRLDYPERKYAIQLAVYRGATYLLDPDGGPPIDLRSIGLRREYAVLVYVDPESGACSIYRVDMRRGQLGANLASQVREWRRERHLLLPYVAPGPIPAATWNAAERTVMRPSDALAPFATESQRAQFDRMASRAEGARHLQAVPTPHQHVNTSGMVPGDSGPLADFTAHPDGSVTDHVTGHRSALDPGTHAVSGGLVNDPGNEHSANSTTASLGDALVIQQATPFTRDALEKMNKASLQGVLRKLDPGASVAHQRKILVDKILTVYGGGSVATSTPKAGADPAEIAGPIGGEDPTDPRSPAFHRARLAEVQAADSVGTLGRIHAYVTRVGGDQAWTDELTDAARRRVAQLDAAQARTIEWNGALLEPTAAVARAASSQEMAQVWNLVTIGGSDEASWTPELNEAALARLAWLDSQVTQQPPSTPFGSPQ